MMMLNFAIEIFAAILMESDRADGVQKNVFLCKNAKVMLTTNLCVPFSLFNGATGTIIDLIYKNENRPENSIPAYDDLKFCH
jgi:hypothetical protein